MSPEKIEQLMQEAFTKGYNLGLKHGMQKAIVGEEILDNNDTE